MLVPTRGQQLVGDAGGSVHQVQSVTGCQVRIQVDQGDLAHQTSALERVRCTGSNQTTTTDNTDFHRLNSLFQWILK